MRNMKIYTDGSCLMKNGFKGGWAFFGVTKGRKIIVSGNQKNTTNNRMEMTAVIEAVKFFNEEGEYDIYTDSKYVINCGLKKWSRMKNIDLWREYDLTMKDKKINFHWVKGHSGDPGNELVDFHSKEEAKICKE